MVKNCDQTPVVTVQLNKQMLLRIRKEYRFERITKPNVSIGLPFDLNPFKKTTFQIHLCVLGALLSATCVQGNAGN